MNIDQGKTAAGRTVWIIEPGTPVPNLPAETEPDSVGAPGIPASVPAPPESVEDGVRYVVATPDSASGSGQGTMSQPFRVVGADDFDALCRVLDADARVHRIHLLPGTYWTRGSWAHRDQGNAHFQRPIHLTGSGPEHTVIALHPEEAVFDSGSGDRPDTNVLWLGTNYNNGGRFVVRDLALDGSHRDLPPGRVVSCGLRLWGNQCHVDNVQVRGLRGDLERELESFGITAVNSPSGPFPGPDGGTLIENCVVSDCAPNTYLTGIGAGYVDYGRLLLPSLVRNCRVLDLPSGPNQRGSHAAYLYNSRVTFRDCFASGFANGFYCDTQAAHDVVITDCQAELTYTALLVAGVRTERDPNPYKRRIRVHHCVFDLTPQTQPLREGIGICILDTKDAGLAFEEIVVEDCVFTIRSARPLVLVSAQARGLKSLRLLRNTFPANARRHLAVPTPGATLLALDNRTPEGVPIPSELATL